MYWRLENYLSNVSKRLANYYIAGASSPKELHVSSRISRVYFKIKLSQIQAPSPLPQTNQTGGCPAVPGLLSTMAHEENIALRQRYELLKGAEHHKNALIEARYWGPSSPNASDLTVCRNFYDVSINSPKIITRRG